MGRNVAADLSKTMSGTHDAVQVAPGIYELPFEHVSTRARPAYRWPGHALLVL